MALRKILILRSPRQRASRRTQGRCPTLPTVFFRLIVSRHNLFGRRAVILQFCLAAFLVTLAPTTKAADWQPAGFGGAGNYLSVVFDPRTPGVVYLASDVAGVFRSSDYGETWEFRSRGLGSYEVPSLAIDPFDPETLYASTGAFAESDKAGMYISRDAGLTWQHLPATAAHGIAFRNNRTLRAIAPDPARPGVILSGSRARGIWRSEDAGESWTQVYAPPMTSARLHRVSAGTMVDDPDETPYPAPIAALVFDPADPEIVFAAVYGFGVVRSAAAGAAGSWQAVNEGLPAQAVVLDLAIGRGGRVYAALERDGVFRSRDGGLTWETVNSGLPLDDLRALSLAVHPEDPDTAYLSTAPLPRPDDYHAAIWKTLDGGESWRVAGKVGFDRRVSPTETWRYYPTEGWQLALDPHDPERLFFTEAWSVNRSDDGGASWQGKVRGAQNTCVTDLAIAPEPGAAAGYRIFSTHRDAGLLASDDRGTTWRAILPRVNAQYRRLAGHYWRVASVPDAGGPKVYVTASPWHQDYTQLLASRDLRVWDSLYAEPEPDAPWSAGETYFAADPTDSNRLYLLQDGGRLFRSDDRGATWQPTEGQPSARRFMELLVDRTGTIFAASFWSGLWRSADRGATWQRVLPGIDLIWDLEDAAGGLYAAADDGNLHRSRDGGVTWQRVSDFPYDPDPDGTGNQVLAVAVDPADPEHIVMSRVDHWHPADGSEGLYESRDGGGSWQPANAGLGHLRIGRLLFAPDGTLYAGSLCGGVWRREAK